MQSIRVSLALCLLLVPIFVRAFDEPENWARVLFTEQASGRPMPLITAIDPSLDIDRAYRIQRFFQQLRSATDQISGFRMGPTGVPPSQQYRLTVPITGVLFENGRVASGATIDLADHPGMMVECHVGFVIAAPIEHPPGPDQDLARLVREVRPVIELPRLHFDGTAVTVPDLIAANGSGGLFIVGAPLPNTEPTTVNALFVELYRGDTVIDRGRASNVMNDQYLALSTLIRTLLAHGQRIEPGQLLLTGALGDSLLAEPGRYRAEFRDAGVVEFEVRDTGPPGS
ncbi:MAG: hypothetical protein IT494_08830 [Gammaproteobacteria bacterium]|nr:hypothetical protein [Gammaproteobacteria bacterium]